MALRWHDNDLTTGIAMPEHSFRLCMSEANIPFLLALRTDRQTLLKSIIQMLPSRIVPDRYVLRWELDHLTYTRTHPLLLQLSQITNVTLLLMISVCAGTYPRPKHVRHAVCLWP